MSLKEQQSHLQQQLGNTETHLMEVKRELEEKVIQVTKKYLYYLLQSREKGKTFLRIPVSLVIPYLFCQVKKNRFFSIPGAVYDHKIHKVVTESGQHSVTSS